MSDEIRFAPINDGREEDCQCARCGSSAAWINCDYCAADGYVEDDPWGGEDGWYKQVTRPCENCGGNGGWRVCLSSAEYCEAHPIAGRESIPRGKVEWFDLPLRERAP